MIVTPIQAEPEAVFAHFAGLSEEIADGMKKHQREVQKAAPPKVQFQPD